MPYASKSQQRFFHSSGAKKAGISPATVEEFNQATKKADGFAKLPEKKVKPKGKPKKVRRQ